MHTKIYEVYRLKTETESTNWGRVYIYLELNDEAAILFGIRFTDKYLKNLFDIIFVTTGKGVSLHKQIK